MNENPGETPNPLNPTPETGASQALENNILDANPSEPMAGQPKSVGATGTDSRPLETTTENFTETVQVESLDPAGRPMEKVAPVTEAPKKKKTGLIIGIIVLILALVGGGIAAAIVLMNMNKPDAVAIAMNKLMSGEAPENVAIDGSVDILFDNDSPISRLNINLDSDIVVGSAINTSSAVLTMTTKDSRDYSMEFSEVYAANGDLYFKVDGAIAAIEDSGILNLLSGNQAQSTNLTDCATGDEDCITETVTTTNCVNDGSTEVNCALGPEEYASTTMEIYSTILAQVIEVIDGEWLKVSVDELTSLSSGFVADSPASCIMTAIGDLNKNSNSTAQLYKKYPFIRSTTEGVIIASKENPVYRVSIDSENFANFVGSIQNAEITSDLYSCLNLDGNIDVTAEDVAKVVTELPKAYVEINGNDEFSRLYIESELNDDTMNVIIDLGLSYPRNVNVLEPVEYTDFSKVIQTIMSSMFSVENTI